MVKDDRINYRRKIVCSYVYNIGENIEHFFHLGMSYGVPETSAIRITRVIEDTLIRSGKFNLPKQLPNRDEVDWEVVVIDATEIL